MLSRWRSQHFFWLSISLFCTVYFLFEICSIPFTLLARDELFFAYHIYQFLHQIPYHDFPPYKGVLGYYLLTLPYFFSEDVVGTLIYIKNEIAIINTLILGIIAVWTVRFFSPFAVMVTLVLIFFSLLFPIYSVELRVDMLACWLGTLAILSTLSKRITVAGAMLAIGFLISQKIVWFWFAMNSAWGICWLVETRNKQLLKTIGIFNLVFFSLIGIYLLVWSVIASFPNVVQSLFYEAYLQASIVWYASTYYLCWQTILNNGPLLFILWPMTWLTLFIRDKNRLFIAIYSNILFFLVISYQQPFPYNALFLFPAFLLTYSNLFTHLFFNNQIVLTQRKLFWLCALASIWGLGIVLLFGLPYGYGIACCIPIFLLFRAKAFYPFLLGSIIFCGIFLPSLQLGKILSVITNDYQQKMMYATHDLLQPNEDYFAGTPLLFNKEQAIPGIKNLIAPAIEYLYTQSPKLKPLLLPSLYLQPRSVEQVIKDLQNSQVKLYVNSPRIIRLPEAIKSYLHSHYQHYWGSIYLYAPLITQNQSYFTLKFTGNYQIQNHFEKFIVIDNEKKPVGTILHLTAGKHFAVHRNVFRLKWLPDSKLPYLSKSYQKEDPYKIEKEIVL